MNTRWFPPTRTAPRYYGWTVVGVAMACSALSSPGQSFFLSLYLEHFSSSLDISLVLLSSLYALATLAAAATLPLIGGLADRLSSRQFLGLVFFTLSLVFVGVSQVSSVWSLGAALFGLRMLAQGAIGLGTITTVVRWFHRYRGRTLAIASLGFSVGEMLFPSFALLLIARVGWRGSWLVYAALYALVVTPLVMFLLRERDSSHEPLDGDGARSATVEQSAGTATNISVAANTDVVERSIPLRDALRMFVFWRVLACVAVAPLVVTGAIFHQIGLFASREWAVSLVPLAFMCFAIAGIVGTYATGLLVERYAPRFALAVAFFTLVIAFAAVWIPLAPLPASLLYGTLLGLASGTMASANAAVWPHYFGTAALGSIKGVVNAIRNGATALGPPIVALLIRPDGSYATSLGVLAAMSALAGLGLLTATPPGEQNVA